jgi:hypothetical protein
MASGLLVYLNVKVEAQNAPPGEHDAICRNRLPKS